MLDVSDLIGCPYKENGRDKNGFDCYGLVIEVCRRIGTPLNDIFSDPNATDFNVVRTDFINTGTILKMYVKGSLHLGVAIDDKSFIHCVYGEGVRISYIKYYPIEETYKVVENGFNSRLQFS